MGFLAQNKQKLLKIFYFWGFYGIYREFHQVVSEYGQKSMIYLYPPRIGQNVLKGYKLKVVKLGGIAWAVQQLFNIV